MSVQNKSSETSTLEDENSSQNKTKIKNLTKSINEIISTLISSNEESQYYKEEVLRQSKMNCYSTVIPSISLLDYIGRLFEYTNCEESTIIIVLIFIDRICSSGVFLSKYIIYRLIAASLMLSIKYNEDFIISNEVFSKIAGISKANLKKIEYEFTVLTHFNFYVSEEQFTQYKNYLEEIINKKYGK